MASLTFYRYLIRSRNFTQDVKNIEEANKLQIKLRKIIGVENDHHKLFMRQIVAGVVFPYILLDHWNISPMLKFLRETAEN